jgi:thiamine biosynthesis protein ThiS
MAVVEAVAGSAPVLVNSDERLARELGLGLHLPEKAPLPGDREQFPLIGRSVHSPASGAASVAMDYVIAGHIFETGSKLGSPPIGLEGLAAIVEVVTCPVLAIGGITPERVEEVIRAGAHGVAIMTGIGASSNPEAATSRYRQKVNEWMNRGKSNQTGLAGGIPVTINGKPVELHHGVTVQAFLDQKKLHKSMVVVEHNGVILKRAQFDSTEIHAGDQLEVVHFVGGG